MQSLRINYVFAGAGMAGGVKSGRLIAEALTRRGHDVRIIFPTRGPTYPPPWRIRFYRRMAQTAEHWWKVRRTARQEHHLERSTATLMPIAKPRIGPEDVPDADFSIANFWRVRELIEDWPAEKGIKCLYVRGHFPTPRDRERMEATYRMGGVYITHARWLVNLLRDDFDVHSVIYAANGVDHEQFGSSARSKQRVPTVGFLYGSSSRKGADTMFEAVRIVRRKLHDLHVVAFGSTPLSSKHAPHSRFEFHLRPSQAQIPTLYRKTDCWVVPSRREGLPMPGLEGAACRCPIVATRCGGPEDYVTEGVSGHLVPVDDPNGMAEAILHVLALSEVQWRAMSEASYRIASGFDWDRSAATIEQGLRRAQLGECPCSPIAIDASSRR